MSANEDFGGIVPVRRRIRGVGPALPPQQQQAAAAAPAAATAASVAANSAAAAAAVPTTISSAGVTLRTAFARESDEVIEARKAQARLPLRRLPGVFSPSGTGTPSPLYYGRRGEDAFPLPERPDWHGKTAAQVEEQEQRMFTQWLEGIYARAGGQEGVNQFEHNLEVWRQLWRVCERSDILLVVVDARNPLLGFSPALYNYITSSLGKPLVLVLNKIDLLPESVLQQWVHYFHSRYPKVFTVPFTSFPDQMRAEWDALEKNKKAKRGKGRTLLKPYGATELLAACRRIVSELGSSGKLSDAARRSFSFEPLMLSGGSASQDAAGVKDAYAGADEYMRAGGDDDLGSSSLSQELKQLALLKATKKKEARRAAIREQLRAANRASGGSATDLPGPINEEEEEALAAEEAHAHSEEEAEDASAVAANAREFSSALGVLEDDDLSSGSSNAPRRAPEDFITLGCIGQPNAGKSSLINALAGRKLLNVSIQPGATKHLQTLFLNRSTRLCDCPGLVCPARSADMPKGVQVLSGHFPIAQTRDPYSAVQFLAERLPLETVYKLTPPKATTQQQDGAAQPAPATSSTEADSSAAAPFQWSAWTLCECLAQKKGFHTRQGAPDVYRAANFVLREVLEGKLTLNFTPPRD